jgi:Phospholipase_D-nuclease N-terminal
VSLFVIWIWLLIKLLRDAFSSDDLSGWAKAFWFVFLIFMPLLGVIFYLVVRGAGMYDRAAQRAKAHEITAG